MRFIGGREGGGETREVPLLKRRRTNRRKRREGETYCEYRYRSSEGI